MTEKPEIVFSTGALAGIHDQETIDQITQAIQAFALGEELPDGMEATVIDGPVELDDEEIAEILKANSHMPADDLGSLYIALRQGDISAASDIIAAAELPKN